MNRVCYTAHRQEIAPLALCKQFGIDPGEIL